MAGFHPRISLLAALLLMTIAGMAIVILQLWREVGPLRAEIRQLRAETGRLSIDDPSNLYAVEVRTEAERSWKWRVWVPKAEKAFLNLQWGDVPEKGVPSSPNSMTMGSGEHWITLSAVRDDVTGQWLSKIASDVADFNLVIPPHEHWFDEPEKFYGIEQGVSYETQGTMPNKKTLVLKRFRVDQVDSAAEVTDKPTAGFIIWLERQ